MGDVILQLCPGSASGCPAGWTCLKTPPQGHVCVASRSDADTPQLAPLSLFERSEETQINAEPPLEYVEI